MRIACSLVRLHLAALLFWFPLCVLSPHISVEERSNLSSEWCLDLDGGWAVSGQFVVEVLHQCLSCGDFEPLPMSSAMVSPGPLLGAITSHSCFPSLPENFTLLSRVRNKPYDVFGCWLNETNLISGNLHRIGRITSCSVLWLNNAFQVRCLCSSSKCSFLLAPGGGKAAEEVQLGKNGSVLLYSLFVSSDLPSGS